MPRALPRRRSACWPATMVIGPAGAAVWVQPAGTVSVTVQFRPDGIPVTAVDEHREREKRQAAPEFVDEPTCPGEPVPPVVEPEPVPSPNRFAALLDATRKTRSLSDLCDALDLAPGKLRSLIDEARAAGYVLHVEHDQVGWRTPEPLDHVQPIGVPPVVGERQRVGVISDTHFGSKYCLRAQLRDCVEYLYAAGVREILHPGDVLDGCYRFARYEWTHSGIEEQTRDAFETLPALPGLTYHIIGGNHDETFSEAVGVDVPQYVATYFRDHGRGDVTAYGNRGAHVKIRGAHVHLWHPRGGLAYANSYGLQKKVEGYSPGEKPQIMLAGHWHRYCAIYERGIHAIACPTFHGGLSSFGKSLKGGAPSLGGLLLEWETTEHGTIRNFASEFRAYFEREAPREIAT